MGIDPLDFELPPLPEPEAYLYVNGDQRGVSLHYRGDMDIAEGVTRKALITTEQADERVREALRQYKSALESQRVHPGEEQTESSTYDPEDQETTSSPRGMRP